MTKEELLLNTINRQQPQAIDYRGTCLYSHKVNGGCAIGVVLPEELAEELDKAFSNDDSGIANIFEEMPEVLPKDLLAMGSGFLKDVQNLHDNSRNWAKTELEKVRGLVWNREGVKFINSIIRKHRLELDEIQLELQYW